MSVALTEDAVRAGAKTVTRRLGWRFLRPNDRLTLCRKVMGRVRRGGIVEPLVYLAEVKVLAVRREPLQAITADDVEREGLPGLSVAEFVEFLCTNMRCTPDTEVTRIEWRYLWICDSTEPVAPQQKGK